MAPTRCASDSSSLPARAAGPAVASNTRKARLGSSASHSHSCDASRSRRLALSARSMMIGIPGSRVTSSLATTDSISFRSNSLGWVDGGRADALTRLPQSEPLASPQWRIAPIARHPTPSCPGNRSIGRRDARSTSPLIASRVVDLRQPIKPNSLKFLSIFVISAGLLRDRAKPQRLQCRCLGAGWCTDARAAAWGSGATQSPRLTA